MTKRTDQDTAASDGSQIAKQVVDAWADALGAVLESMTANRPKIELRESTSTEWAEGTSWWGQRLSLLDQPSFWIGAPAESWTALGRLVLSALGVDDPSDSDVEATCRDVMAQTSAMVATQLTQQFGTEITGGDPLTAAQPDSVAAPAFKWSMDAGLMSMEGTAVCAEAFLSRCSSFAAPPAVEEAESRAPEAASPASSEPAQFGGRTVASIPRLDLRVKFVLGRTTLPLAEIFKLNIGSAIELDHSAIDPAEVVIQGRVFARGQVVVVNGNYGLKILPPPR
jgi:flagellar motor switch protein FliN/FliY